MRAACRLPETGDFRLGYVEFDEQASTSKAGYMVLQLRERGATWPIMA
ncbi:MAG: hypothetical protein ACLR1P_09965 [Oscillospiraceae bacterium]